MSQVQAFGPIDPTLQTIPGSCISSNDTNEFVNREMNFVMASSTSSEALFTQSHQDLHPFHGTNQANGDGPPVLFQGTQDTPSMSSYYIISGQDMGSMADTPFWGLLSVRGQPHPSAHPESAIQTQDGGQVLNVAVDPRQHVDRSLPIPNRHPTAADWQACRTVFTQLYSVENKTLEEVVGIMKERYNFRARWVLSILIFHASLFSSSEKVADHLLVHECLSRGSKTGDSARTTQQQSEKILLK
jgi:hypothetical protein